MLLSTRLIGKFLIVLGLVGIVAGCNHLTKKTKSDKTLTNITLDEKPEILDISVSVIWNGEQTLGGNWVSHPSVDSPERVSIKNISNGKSIIGAVFKQTKKIKTEPAVISSDAARALDIVKNEPTKVQIIAIRVTEENSPTPNTLKLPQKTALLPKQSFRSLSFKWEYLVSKIMLRRQKIKCCSLICKQIFLTSKLKKNLTGELLWDLLPHRIVERTY